MANYEQKIFEQVIDSYFGENQNNLKVEEEVNLSSVNFKIKKSSNENKNDTTGTKKTAENQKKKRESKSKAVLIEAEYHENLPQGWKKVVVQRTTGATAGKYDVYFFTPSGRKLRSKNEIKDYSEKHRLNLDLANFGFSRPRREKTIAPKTPNNKKNKIKGVASPMMAGESNSMSVDASDSNSTVSDNLHAMNSPKNSDPIPPIHSSMNGDNSTDNLLMTLSNIDEEIRSLTEGFETPVELDLPNTSFTNSSSANSQAIASGESVEFDIDQSHLGKTFKIERPLSFSCF